MVEVEMGDGRGQRVEGRGWRLGAGGWKLLVSVCVGFYRMSIELCGFV